MYLLHLNFVSEELGISGGSESKFATIPGAKLAAHKRYLLSKTSKTKTEVTAKIFLDNTCLGLKNTLLYEMDSKGEWCAKS